VLTDPSSTTRISGTAVTRNSAGAGGGLLNVGTMVLTGDRVLLNHADTGGGIRVSDNGTVTLRHTVVALNSPDNCSPQGTIRGCRH
jgi:hypothetical protein